MKVLIPILSLGLALFLLLVGCGGGQRVEPLGPIAHKLGKPCNVQFRRGDALGGGSNLPVSPTTGSINGAEVALSGTLVSLGDGWVVVSSANNKEYHIPVGSILMIEFPN